MDNLGYKMDNKNEEPNINDFFHCQYCLYNTSRKCNYNRHILTSKHIFLEKESKNEQNEQSMFQCKDCNKIYKYRSGLTKHKKKCLPNTEITELSNLDLDISSKQLIQMLIKDNSDFKKMILDICKNIQPTTINQMNMNSNNKTFNLQVFLNETCKDAMNIMDFVNSVQLQLSDLENVGREGYVNGISNIIIKNLQTLDVEKRPIHCSDFKREIIYIKDNDKWEKENDDKMKIKKVIKFIANKNSRLISKFKEKYPDCIYSDSDKSDQYNKLIIEALGGMGDNDDEKCNKIIKKIAKAVVINKSIL